MSTVIGTTSRSGGKAIHLGLWAAQILLALAFGFFGSMKALQPLDQIATMMKWVPTVSPMFVRALGTAEVLGAVGLILPSMTRVKPQLTVAAAISFVVLQVLAIGLHASRGETAQTIGLNIVLLGLALFVAWGRSTKAAILPR